MPMQSLRSIENDTPATATDVSWNFGTLDSFINNNLLNIDGSLSMTGQLTLVGNPLSNLDAASKQYVDAIQPVGMIVDYAGAAAPSGWLLCDGSVVDQASYLALYAVCGATYNTGGEGDSQFRLPNFTDRVALGVGADARGTKGGSNDAVVVEHVHEVPLHNHSLSSHVHNLNSHTHTTPNHLHTSPDHDHKFLDGNTDSVWIQGNPTPTGGTSGIGISSESIGSGGFTFKTETAGVVGSNNTGNANPTTNGPNVNDTEGPSVANTGSKPATDTEDAGVIGTGLNLPQFLAVNKIIKAA